jgi:putative endonuclease
MKKQFYLYIMTNPKHTVTYVGVTSNLQERVLQHREKSVPGFTSRYNINKLVYYEIFPDAYSAISREKQIKGGSREKKVELINSMNPKWEDLSEKL